MSAAIVIPAGSTSIMAMLLLEDDAGPVTGLTYADVTLQHSTNGADWVLIDPVAASLNSFSSDGFVASAAGGGEYQAHFRNTFWNTIGTRIKFRILRDSDSAILCLAEATTEPQVNTKYVAGTVQTAGDVVANQTTLLARTGYWDDYTWLDPDNGVAGTTVGTHGLISNKSNSFANAITIAQARAIHKIKLAEGFNDQTVAYGSTFPMMEIDLNGWELVLTIGAGALSDSANNFIHSSGSISAIEGDDSNTLYPLGTGNRFKNLVLQNVSTKYAYCENCIIQSLFKFIDALGSISTFANCYSNRQPGAPPEIAFAASHNSTRLEMLGWAGDFVISGLKGSQVINCLGYGGKITINDDCVAGTIYHTSHMEVFDEAGAAWVNGSGKPTVELISEPGGVSGFTSDATDAITSAVEAADVNVDSFTAAAISQMASLTVNITPTFSNLQNLQVVQGDDYEDDVDSALVVTLSGITQDMTGATAHLYWERGAEQYDWSSLSVTASGSDWVFKFERTAAQTTLMTAADDWAASLVAILASSKRVTLARTRAGRVLDRFDD